MRLIDAIGLLMERQLTPEESNSLSKFQQAYGLDDADPIVVVLAMLGANKILIEDLPNILQQKSMQLIELHKQTLLEQSKYISKMLVAAIAEDVQQTNKIYNKRWINALLFFVGGMLTAFILLAVTIHYYPIIFALH